MLFRLRQEVDMCRDLAWTLVLYDFRKFYDSISVSALVWQAKDLGYPLRQLSLLMQLYMGPRVVKSIMAYSQMLCLKGI